MISFLSQKFVESQTLCTYSEPYQDSALILFMQSYKTCKGEFYLKRSDLSLVCKIAVLSYQVFMWHNFEWKFLLASIFQILKMDKKKNLKQNKYNSLFKESVWKFLKGKPSAFGSLWKLTVSASSD